MAQFKSFIAASRKPNLQAFGMFPRGTDLSWIAAYPLIPPLETPVGTQNGVNATFTVSGQFIDIWVFKNGLMLAQGVDYTFNGDSGTITFLAGAIPESTDQVRVAVFSNADGELYQPVASSAAPTVETPSGAIDGANNIYSLSKSPQSLQLFWNGQRLEVGVGYTLAGASVTMATDYIPQTGDSLVAVFW